MPENRIKRVKQIYIVICLLVFILLAAAGLRHKSISFMPEVTKVDTAGVFITDIYALLPGEYEADIRYDSQKDTTLNVFVDRSGTSYPFTLQASEERYSFPFYIGEYGEGLCLSYPASDDGFSIKELVITSEGRINNDLLVLALSFLAMAVYVFYMVMPYLPAGQVKTGKKTAVILPAAGIVLAAVFSMIPPVSVFMMRALRLSSRRYVLLLCLAVFLFAAVIKSLLRDLGRIARALDQMMEGSRAARITAFAVLCVLFLFTRLYRLGSMMDGIHVDEIGAGYDALCIKDYGVDRWTVRYPVYFENYGTGQNALYTYLASVVFCFTDFSVFALRLPAVFCGFLGFVAAYVLAGKLFGAWRYRFMTAFLMIVCPMFFLSQRWGLESYLLCSLIFVSMTFLYFAIDTGRGAWYVLTGTAFGITLYTYAITYILEPVFLLLAAAYLLWLKKTGIKNIILCAVPFTILAVPLALEQLINAGYIGAVYTPFNDFIPMQKFRGTEFDLSHFAANLRIAYRLITADDRPYNGSAVYGSMYYITVPFILLGAYVCCRGMIRSFRKKQFDYRTFIFVFFVISLIESLTVEELNINRSNEIYFCFLLFAVFGLELVEKRLPNTGYALIPVYILLFISFCGYYFGHNGMMADISRSEMHSTLLQPVDLGIAARDATRKYGDRGKLYIIDHLDEFQELIVAAYEGVSPYEFNKDSVNNSIYDSGRPEVFDPDGKTFYIVKDDDLETMEALKEAGFRIEAEPESDYVVALSF